MGKYETLAVIALAVLTLVACFNRTAVFGEPQIYDVTSEIYSLDIQIKAADFTIVHGDKLSVESNLRNLTVIEKDGVLIIEEKPGIGLSYTNAMLKLCVPDDVVFEKVKIKTGAGKLTVAALSADTLILKLGAGQVQFDSINANSGVVIEGGAGEIAIASGTLHNLNLRLGIGKFRLTAALLGNSDLQFGIGESNLTLIGSREDYKLDITRGIGSIHVDGYTGSDFSGGNVQSYVKIQGGIGAANIVFHN